ncbi:hypothetical protein AB0L88_12080 [Saccharopolyspora shandongensis]|uniref:hypothetical protein n=1 Tax=Saccharopolyspora shandongensis TaxID=418495 RepID=UPI00343270DC
MLDEQGKLMAHATTTCLIRQPAGGPPGSGVDSMAIALAEGELFVLDFSVRAGRS